MINLYNANETDFTHNGLVVLSDCKAAHIEEELNGKYELTLEYPLDSRGKWQYLSEGNVIKADGQLFRIYNKQKTLAGIAVNARHIFYDLMDNFLEDVRPENLTGAAALNWILSRTQFPHHFTSTSDVGGSNTRYFIRQNVVEAIMGDDGLISRWGGEIERDNFIIRYRQDRGLDRGVLVSYGKNIIGIDETINLDSVCTRMMPLGYDGLLLPEKYIDSPYIENYPHPKVRVVNFNDAETESDLRSAAQVYMDEAGIDIPLVNYSINFIELSKTEEYKNYAVLERVYMGDTVTIRHSKLEIDLKAKVIRIKKNILTNRIEEVELGSFKPNIATAISAPIAQVRKQQEQDKTALQSAIDNATDLLTTALGGHVLKRENELLIMDTADPMTAQKVWRWNLNGLGYSSTGINGPYGLAMTMNGGIVADFVNTGNLDASIITTGVLLGIVIKTAISGERLEMSGNILTGYNSGNQKTYELLPDRINFYDNLGIAGTLEGFSRGLRLDNVSRMTIMVDGSEMAYVREDELDMNGNNVRDVKDVELERLMPRSGSNRIYFGPGGKYIDVGEDHELYINADDGASMYIGETVSINIPAGGSFNVSIGGSSKMRVDDAGIHGTVVP